MTPTRFSSLLTLLTSAIAACGETRPESPDATTDGAAEASSRDGGGSTNDGSPIPDDSGGSATEAGGDDAADSGCPQGWTPFDGGCTPITVRRPFLVGSSLRAAVARPRTDWAHVMAAAATLDPSTRARLAQAWLADGLEEHASIAAFARFTLLLLSVGAPPELIAASQRASLDEVRHAERCFALAARYGARALGPSSLTVHDAMTAMSLAEIAALTAEEGCVGETLGAVLAAAQRDRATDPEARRVLAGIARDEERHAALAWSFVRWAVVRGGAEVRTAVARAVERAIEGTLAMEIRRYDDVNLETWHAHGRVTCAEAREVAHAAIDAIVRPCLGAALQPS
jgi:hypothetical protein